MRFFVVIPMEAHQDAAYRQLAGKLTAECRQAPARRDITLIGVVLNVLLAYTVYSGTRDTTSRLKRLLEQAGMDLLGFPIIVILQTGYNVYTLQ